MALWTVRRTLARWLHRWAKSVLPEEDRDAVPAAPPETGSEEPEPEPELFLHGGGGPPEHWIALVRDRAPELLLPADGAPPPRVFVPEEAGEIEAAGGAEGIEEAEARVERPATATSPRPVPPAPAAPPPASEPPAARAGERGRAERSPEALRGGRRGEDRKDTRRDLESASGFQETRQEAPAAPPLRFSPTARSLPVSGSSKAPAPDRAAEAPPTGLGFAAPAGASLVVKAPPPPSPPGRPRRSAPTGPPTEPGTIRRPAAAPETPHSTEDGVKPRPATAETGPPSPMDKPSPFRVAEGIPRTSPSPALFERTATAPAVRTERRREAPRWPTLPEPPREEPGEPAAAVREWQRQRRIDREQQEV